MGSEMCIRDRHYVTQGVVLERSQVALIQCGPAPCCFTNTSSVSYSTVPTSSLAAAASNSAKLAEMLSATVCCDYQHKDAFPNSHPLLWDRLTTIVPRPPWLVDLPPDVLLALGTRLNFFSTLRAYGSSCQPTGQG